MKLVDGRCLWSNTICANVARVTFHFIRAGCSPCSPLCEPTHPLCSPVALTGPSQPNYLATNVVFLEFSLNCWNTLLLNTRLPWMFSIAFYGAPSIFVSDGPEQSHRICGLRDNGCVTFCLTQQHHPLWQNDRDSLVERNRETISALRSNTVYSAFIIIWKCIRLVQQSQTRNSWTLDPNRWT